MRLLQKTIATVLFATIACTLTAAEDNFPIDIYNFLRIEYDDNVFSANEDFGSGPVESAVIVEQIEFLLDSRQGNTYYGLRYSPSYHYYDDRPEDDDDWNHQADIILEQDFSPRTSAQLKYTLRASEESELVEDDVTFRANNDYIYNSVAGNVTTQIAPDKTSLRFRANYSDFAYQEDIVADFNDYSEIGGGIDLIQTLTPDSSLTGIFGYREIDYTSDFRDAEIYRIAASYSKVFNPKFQSILAIGWEQQNSDDPISEDLDAPYANVSLVMMPSKGTSLTVGGGYGIQKSPVNTFSAQERARIFGRLNQELTAAMNFIFEGSFNSGSFDASSATSLYDPAVNSDGDEDVIQVLTALNYDLNVRNSLELAWRYIELESDVRPASDYDRNRYYLGWKYRL